MNIKSLFRHLFSLEHDVDSKIYRKALVQYTFSHGGEYLHHITKVWATTLVNNTHVVVHIKTHQPGILIGKQGIQIAGIREMMEYMSGKSVEIDIVEEDMFSGIWS